MTELDAVLAELAAADTDRTEHHSVRFKRGADEKCECCGGNSKAKTDDWNRCYSRFEAAVAAVVKSAHRRAAETEPAPESGTTA